MPIKCVKSYLGPGTWQWGTRNPRTAIPTQAVPDIFCYNPTGHSNVDNSIHPHLVSSQYQRGRANPSAGLHPLAMLLSTLYTEEDSTGRRGRGTEQEERGVPARTCDSKWPCLWEEQKELIPGAPGVWQRQAYAFTTYQGDVTKRVKLSEALSTLPKPHTGIVGALEDRGSMSNPYTKSPWAPLPPFTEHPPVATRSVLSRAATDDTQ